MSLYKRVQTQLAGKMGPALRVAYRDVGKGREPGGGSFAYRDVGKQREHGGGSFAYMDVGKQRENGYGSFAPEKAPLGVACRDASQGREQDAVSFARCSFGATKPRASRLAYRDVGKGREPGGGSFDWRFFRGNSNNCVVLTGPSTGIYNCSCQNRNSAVAAGHTVV